MAFLFVNSDELSALMGLSHLQQSAYLLGIRPYMDRETYLVGVKRRISYQSLAEMLYVEPHPGITQSGSPSRQQLRRVVYALERAGLVAIQSSDKQLILKCLLADSNNCVPNKPDTIPAHQPGTNPNSQTPYSTSVSEKTRTKTNTFNQQQPDTPHKSENYFVCLREPFDKFWSLYPMKQDEAKAQQEYFKLNPDETLQETILQALHAQIQNRKEMEQLGKWLPHWKYPANWLAQRSWNDELLTPKAQEKNHGTLKQYPRKKSAVDILAESCEDASFDFDCQNTPSTGGNVVQFN